MKTSKFLVIKLCDEIFGIDMSCVHEIVPYREPTAIPGSPDYIEGIVAIRGDVIVAINLRKMLNLYSTIAIQSSHIVIVNSAEIQIGFIVDETSNIISADIHSSGMTSEIYTGSNMEYIIGIINYMGVPIKLLDLEVIVREIEI